MSSKMHRKVRKTLGQQERKVLQFVRGEIRSAKRRQMIRAMLAAAVLGGLMLSYALWVR
jgi:lipid-A-disaccharide synthase-like uncharacterized protein